MGHQAARRQIHIAPRLRRVGHRSRGHRSPRQSHRPQDGKDGMNLPRSYLAPIQIPPRAASLLPRMVPKMRKSCLAPYLAPTSLVCARSIPPCQRSRAGRVACPSLEIESRPSLSLRPPLQKSRREPARSLGRSSGSPGPAQPSRKSDTCVAFAPFVATLLPTRIPPTCAMWRTCRARLRCAIGPTLRSATVKRSKNGL
jgi:hypothetical protein